MSDKAVIQKPVDAVVVQDNPATILQLAIEKGLDPATISKMMDLQERWDKDKAHKAFVAAMAGFKRDCPSVIGKDMKADYGQGKAKYSYASTAAIVQAITPHLSKHGLHLYWESQQAANTITITCYVAHEAGHKECAVLSGPRDESGGKNPIQTIGSSVSYLQRYTMRSVLGLATADMDDDADNAPKQRAPVAMPTARAKPTPTAQAAPAPEPPASPTSELVKGKVEKVEESKCANKAIKYGIKLTTDARVFGTFHKSHGEAARCYHGEGIEVEATIAPNGKLWDLLKLEPVDESGNAATTEDLPFE